MSQQKKKTKSNTPEETASSRRRKQAPAEASPASRSRKQREVETTYVPAEPAASASRQRSPMNRKNLTAGIICMALAVISVFYIVSPNAPLMSFYKNLVGGLIGMGFFISIPALVFAGIFLLRRNVFHGVRRAVCCLIVPAVTAVLYQIPFLKPVGILTDLRGLRQTFDDGSRLIAHCGGVIGTIVASLGVNTVRKPFSFILVLFVLILLLFVIVLDITPLEIPYYLSVAFSDRKEQPAKRRSAPAEEEPAYAEEEPVSRPQAVRQKAAAAAEALPRKKRKPATASAPTRSSRMDFDIPMDDDPTADPDNDSLDYDSGDDALTVFDLRERGPVGKREKTAPRPAKKPVQKAEVPAEKPEEKPVQKPAVKPSSNIDIPFPEEDIEVEQKPKKVTKKEARTEARKVAREIAKAEPDENAYRYPTPELLTLSEGPRNAEARTKRDTEQTMEDLGDILSSFGINPNLKGSTCGPTVALYKLELDPGVKLTKLTNLADDIALNLGVSGVRIAPVEGEARMVGIEVPNRVVTPVPIRTVIDSDNFKKSSSKVAFAVGKDISGTAIVGDIAKLPHLLIAGTTGSGKSVCINGILISLLYKASPNDVKLIMVDPKKVELGIYNGIPHLLIPVVTEPKKAAGALQWAVVEMMRRYSVFSEVGARKLSEYNKMADSSDGEYEHMPSVVVVIDELADLMLVAAKEVEESICRIAQLGRAAGMHLVVATQRPSSDVITGLMKANIPSRIAFSVASAMESRIILDTAGAEKLVGKGDMLYHPIGAGKPQRVQGCMISDDEVAEVVQYVKSNCGVAEYDEEIVKQVNVNAEAAGAKNGKSSNGSANAEPEMSGMSGDYDELLLNAVDIVLEIGNASVSMLQRRLKLGYSRAARLVDQMEELGYVGPFEGSKPRQLLITKEEWAARRASITEMTPEQLAIQMNDEAEAEDIEEDSDEDPDDLDY